MDEAKRRKLEHAGWTVGSPAELLGMSEAEEAYVELRLNLSRKLKEERARRALSQGEVARRLRSSQSRVAKMEAGDPSVSLDLLIRALLAVGATRRDIAGAIAPPKKPRAA
jgi:ribosome-binding protein aMBF1 (putative translation factor)